MTEDSRLPNPQCCRAHHPFDAVQVERYWLPSNLRYLIIGESPGAPGAAYFYDQLPAGRDPITVRRVLLSALHESKLIASPTLESFRDTGFLCDHAIRCQLPMVEIDNERQRAARFESFYTDRIDHLRPLIESAERVWAMGIIARNAIAQLYPSMRRVRRKLTPPYRLPDMPKAFVSRYFTRFHTPEGARQIVDVVRPFLLSSEQAN